MKKETLDRLVWALIYAGMFIAGLGIWFMAQPRATGWTLLFVGGAMIALAAYMIWLRSRRSE